MSNYWYKLKNTNSNKRKHNDERNLILVDAEVDVVPTVLHSLLSKIREERLNKLLSLSDDETPPDPNTLREHLPSQYKQYADDINKLKEQMASLYEISQMYEVSDIQLAPTCIGCIYDCPGQLDHMECPSGCLHETELCFLCS